MKPKKNILFLLHTEFHVLMSVSIIERYFTHSRNFKVYVILQSSAKGKRFQFDLDFSHLPVEFHRLDLDKKELSKSDQLISLLNYIDTIDFEKYISFLEHAPLNWYLADRLSKKGTEVCLAPEGTKPYISISKNAFPSRIKQTIDNYNFFKFQGLKFKKFFYVRNTHATLSVTDTVWVTNANLYNNKTNKKVEKIEIFNNSDNVKTVSRVFNFVIDDYIDQKNNLILYFNHWVVENKIYDVEIEMLSHFRKEFPNKSIIIKLHPGTPDKQIERFKEIEGVQLNTSTMPAELFVANVKDCIIISFWSASLLFNNPTCRFYWLHPFLKKEGVLPHWFSIVNPTKHIKEVESLDRITS